MADLKAIQHALNGAGFGPLTEDGISGPATQGAVKKFQAAKGLTVDGIVGPQTLAALNLPTDPHKPALTSIPGPAIQGLWQSVVDHFTSGNIAYEGYTPYLYTDSKGLVTTGIGDLVESNGQPSAIVYTLPWTHGVGGPRATRDEIDAAWRKVKAAWPGVQSTASQALTDLRIDQSAVAQLVNSKLQENHNYLKSKFPNYVSWPADAQMAMNFLSWAWGPGFASVWGQRGADFTAAANKLRPDFVTMANLTKDASVHEEQINPGIIPRDAAVEHLFSNADSVLSKNADPSQLYFPNDVVQTVMLGSLVAIGLWGAAAGAAFGIAKWKGWV